VFVFVTSDGRFALRGLCTGFWRLLIAAPGTEIKAIMELDLPARTTTDLGDITLQRGKWITGVVRNAARQPVVDARVLIGFSRLQEIDPLLGCVSGTYDTRTDTSGRYVFSGVAGTHRSIVAEHPIQGTTFRKDVANDGAIDFVLVPGGHITGVVDQFECGMAVCLHSCNSRKSSITHVAPDGTFQFDNLPSGTYELLLAGGSDRVTVDVKSRETTHVRMTKPI
jgi:hypothetical protein